MFILKSTLWFWFLAYTARLLIHAAYIILFEMLFVLHIIRVKLVQENK